MQPSNRFNDLSETDKIYEVEDHIIKIRILDKTKDLDPIVFEISASICDENGKALKRGDGYYIRPAERHTLNLSNDIDIQKEMDIKIEKCLNETIIWYQKLTMAENFYASWKS